jgi:hypothetical protein
MQERFPQSTEQSSLSPLLEETFVSPLYFRQCFFDFNYIFSYLRSFFCNNEKTEERNSSKSCHSFQKLVSFIIIIVTVNAILYCKYRMQTH